MNRFVAAVLAIVLFPAPALARGPTPAERLERARACYAALDFGCAERELSAAREGLSGLAGPQAVQVLALSAQVALATGRRQDAVRHLGALLEREPRFEPPPGAWPSGWLAELARARAVMPDVTPPEVAIDPVPPATARGAVRVSASVADPSGVGEVVLVIDGGPRLPMVTSDGRRWSAEVPAHLVDVPGFAVRVEARDSKGNGPSTSAPTRVEVRPAAATAAFPSPPAPPVPLVRQWWFWTVVSGVAVAGTATLAYFLWPRGSDGAEPPGPGRVNVGFRWSSL